MGLILSRAAFFLAESGISPRDLIPWAALAALALGYEWQLMRHVGAW